MPFTDDQISQMQLLFKRIEPTTIESLQVYKKENEHRTGCTQVIKNRWANLFVYFKYSSR